MATRGELSISMHYLGLHLLVFVEWQLQWISHKSVQHTSQQDYFITICIKVITMKKWISLLLMFLFWTIESLLAIPGRILQHTQENILLLRNLEDCWLIKQFKEGRDQLDKVPKRRQRRRGGSQAEAEETHWPRSMSAAPLYHAC